MNENIVRFIIEDWMSNRLGEYATLYDLEVARDEIVGNDKEVKQAREFLHMVENQLADEAITKAVKDAVEQLEDQVYEDMYMFGLDADGNVVPIDW